MSEMPASYLAEKITNLTHLLAPLQAEGTIDTWSPTVSHTRLLAQAIIDEIDAWRNA